MSDFNIEFEENDQQITLEFESGVGGAVSSVNGMTGDVVLDADDVGAYTKPAGGIPKTDLASAVQASLGKADSAYQKPSSGIPASDMANGVIPAVDDTLSVAGTAADAKKTGDELSSLKEELGDSFFSVASNNDWQHIEVAGDWRSGDVVYIRPISSNLVSYVNISRVTNGAPTTILANQPTETDYWLALTADCDAIRVSYKLSAVVQNTEYSAIVKKVGDKNDAFGLVINNMSDTRSINVELAYFDNPIDIADKSDVAKNWLKGILGIEIYDTQYEKYCIWYLWHGVNGRDLYVNVRGWDGTTWVSLDNIERLTAPSNRPILEAITSNNGKFRMLIDWNQTPSSVNINSSASVYYAIKDRCIVYTDYVNKITQYVGIGDYELKDSTKHIITVKKDGTGDFTTIADAYASITDSSFLNQYEVVVYEGIYEEYNLICPSYTHTHGLKPNTVTVTSVGVSSTLPVFDQKNAPSKLSNMTIISGTGYCVHQDANLNGVVLVNENLYCKKVYDTDVPNFSWQQKTNPAIVGDGAQYYGAKFIWKSCIFENGEVAFHSNSNANPNCNQHVIFKDCKLVNAWFELMMAGNETASTDSFCVAEFDGSYAPKGCPFLKCKFGSRIDNESNFVWQVIGGNNKNFSIIWDNTSDTLAIDAWDNISTNDKAFVQATTAVTKGQWVTDALAVCAENENPNNVMGVALTDAAVGDTFSIWVGNAYRYASIANGEYGIGLDGALSASATTKIGKVLNNIFYRY